MLSNIRQTDTWLSFGLAFVGGYGDAASFVLAKTFTGHVTGNLVLTAIAVATHDWRATLEHLLAIVTFLIGISLTVRIAVDADAKNFSIEKTEDAVDVTYSGMTTMTLGVKTIANIRAN